MILDFSLTNLHDCQSNLATTNHNIIILSVFSSLKANILDVIRNRFLNKQWIIGKFKCNYWPKLVNK